MTDAEVALLDAMRRHLAAAIEAAGGSLPFDGFMEMALYAPGLGYYVNGRRKLGEGGDFTTAPEVSPLFGQCLAQQTAECLRHLGGGQVLEIGAGSGRMAGDLLAELARLEMLPEAYLILELSPDLQAAQRETLARAVPDLLPRVHWLQSLPEVGWQGVVLGNELLDAMPVHRFRRRGECWQELHVGIGDDGFEDRWQTSASPRLAEALGHIWPGGAGPGEAYASEINLRLAPWLQALAQRIVRGYLLLIDYGYTRAEYYHPQRSMGTLICHHRQRAHADPYLLPGLQDITASVDFTALAEAALAAGLQVVGYTTQAHFLIDNGLEQRLAPSDPNDPRAHLQLMQGVKRLTLPGEMGERFKVMALACDAPDDLSGFRSRDLRDRL